MKSVLSTLPLTIGILFLLTCCNNPQSRPSDTADETTESVNTPQHSASTPPGSPAQHNPKARPQLPSPSLSKIRSDLAGRVITEGKSDGYHRDDWTHTIEHGTISNIQVYDTIVDQPDLLILELQMDIRPNSSFYYHTTLKVNYINDAEDGWILDNVNSLGMDVVSNHAYDDCIIPSIQPDGWGGTYQLSLRNNSESTLIVGGRVHTDQWHKFSQQIPGHESATVGGVFGGGSVNDYKIDFVVKEF